MEETNSPDQLIQVPQAASEIPITPETAPGKPDVPWLTPGVIGIGSASFLADVGHEIPTSLLLSLLTSTMGAPAAALGLI